MPNVTVVQKVKTENGLSLLLKVTNPTLGSVRLRFAPSSYPGEPDFDNDSQTTTHLADLLVDTLSQKRVSANVTHLLNDFEPTNTVELLSAEDSIIEMGGRAHEIPDEVRSWQPSSSVFSVVAQKASSAWLGVNLPVQDVESPVAVPFAMQIEVGNGSWDSALIQSQATEEQADRATFDLVVILQ